MTKVTLASAVAGAFLLASGSAALAAGDLGEFGNNCAYGLTQGVKKFGLTVGPITASMAQSLGLNSPQGVVIMDVAAGSAADWAGLQAKDVIMAVNLEPVKSIQDWNTIVGELSDDAAPMLTVFRNGMTQFVTLGQ